VRDTQAFQHLAEFTNGLMLPSTVIVTAAVYRGLVSVL
jgi:hypothetical protein